MEAFSDIFEDCTSQGTKIPKEEYLSDGRNIIIDQGQNIIAGYTDLEEGLFQDVPAIIFGDHTRIIKYVEEPFFLGADGVKLLKSKKKDANYKYLYYALKNARIPDTGYNRHFKWLKEVKIEYPNLEKQQSVVEILDKITSIIDERMRELEAFDKLIKARFVEMFGELIINPYGWDEVNISSVVRGKPSNGFFAKREDYNDDGNVSIMGVAHIVNRMYSNYENLPKTNATESEIQKFSVGYGDLLFCRSSLVAEGIGKASAVPLNVPSNTLFECHVIRLQLDLNKVVPEYIQTLTTMDYFRNQILSSSKTATMTTIGQDGIMKCKIMLPPYEKQREFLEFVKQTDKSKVAVQNALNETQLLFDSLMQEYFG